MKGLLRVLALILVISLLINTAFAEEKKNPSALDVFGNWFNQAADDVSAWTTQAADDASSWASQAWEDSSEWANQAWKDSSAWATQAWSDVSKWTAQAWEDSSKWVSQAWVDSSEWASVNWDAFIVWVNTVTSGYPYDWIKDVILENGILAYDEYVELRSFLNSDPDLEQIKQRYDVAFSALSLLNEDKETLWKLIGDWSKEKGLQDEQITKLALPFLVRLVIEGESAIGENAEFSGPVIGQYLLTILDAMNLDSSDAAEMRLKILHNALEGLTRPIIIGDTDQNQLVTEDRYYIENFTYADGKYQIIMMVSLKGDDSQYPVLNGRTVQETAKTYFTTAEFGDPSSMTLADDVAGEVLPFSCNMAGEGTSVTGEMVTLWAKEHIYQFYFVTDQEWNEADFSAWLESVALTDSKSVSLDVDMESDGAFYGINQTAQKYTINRIFEEAKFLVPKTGHGWAAERGNNLIDNLKGFFKKQHSTVVGDNNAANGADRITQLADGSIIRIQSKYYSSASRSIASCFDEKGFRYIDHAEGKPMAIEVPSDQYEQAISYIKNRIANGDFREWGYDVTDTERAVEIVKKGHLTYNQARHIAKAGTVESILYDAYHACITATTAMGLSAAANFAINIWNGEPIDTAIKESILQGLKSGGLSFIISVLSAQAAKSGLNTALMQTSKVIVRALGPKASAAIVNAFRPAGSAIYGAAAMQSAAKLLRGNMITSAITFVVLSAGDVADIIQGRISWKQLAKNVSSTAVGVAGGTLGWIGGAAIGTAILPGAGTVVGIICSVMAGWGANEGAKALADLIAEDDADEMIRIIEEQFATIAAEYFLNEEEVNKSVANLQSLLTPEMLKQMFQYKNHEAFARQMIEMAIDPVVAERQYVELPSDEQYSDYLTSVLEEIYEDIGDETATEE